MFDKVKKRCLFAVNTVINALDTLYFILQLFVALGSSDHDERKKYYEIIELLVKNIDFLPYKEKKSLAHTSLFDDKGYVNMSETLLLSYSLV